MSLSLLKESWMTTFLCFDQQLSTCFKELHRQPPQHGRQTDSPVESVTARGAAVPAAALLSPSAACKT
jgi:hypothetical protein